MGSTIKGFVTNPLTIAVNNLFDRTKVIGDEFGAMGVTDFRNRYFKVTAEFTRLGLSGEDALKSNIRFTNFGFSRDEAL